MNKTEKFDEDAFSSIGETLRTLRLYHGFNQKALADALGITVSAYSHYERDDRLPDIGHLVRIANLYGINLSYLVLITCVGITRNKDRDLKATEVFDAYSHDKSLTKDDALILAKCSRLTPAHKINLHLFLDAAAASSHAEIFPENTAKEVTVQK